MFNVIDNFLDKESFLKLKTVLLSDEFPWYYTNVLDRTPVNLEAEKYNFQFTHTFYKDKNPNSSAIFILDDILKKISSNKIIRIKANLGTRTETVIQHGFHTDYENCTTAIFYINSNNGKTVFKDTSIESIENRLVMFDSNILHSGTTCTDANVRCVINFNFT